MAAAPHPVLARWYGQAEARVPFVNDLFDQTARHYDWICKAMAFGTGEWHRQRALRRAGFVPGMRLLDLATGTGLVAQAALDLGSPPHLVVGLDPSLGMLQENRRRRAIPLVRAGGEQLPFGAAHFDFVTIGYALRHVADLGQLFAECARVLRPGGRLLVLEITRPRSRLGFALCRLYLRGIVPKIAGLLRRDRKARQLMEYYWDTIEACVPPEAILAAIQHAGLRDATRKVTGAILSDYVASR